MTRPKTNRGGPRFGGGPRGPRKGQSGSGRPPMPEEVRMAIVEALRAPRATIASVVRAFGLDRKTIRRIRDESGIEPAKKGRRKVEK